MPHINKLPFLNPKKINKLYIDIEIKVCNPHDDRFELWWWLFAFLRANYIFALDLISLLQWTTITGRLGVFLIAFFWLNIFGIRYFNWGGKKSWKT